MFLCGKLKNSSQCKSNNQRAKKTKFCIADVKKAPRCGVELQEYLMKKMNHATSHTSAHSYLQDILRGSLVFRNAAETSAFIKRLFKIIEN